MIDEYLMSQCGVAHYCLETLICSSMLLLNIEYELGGLSLKFLDMVGATQ